MYTRCSPDQLIVELDELSSDQSPELLLNNRFTVFAHSHNSAIMMGSSLSYIDKSFSEGVLDASSNYFLSDKDHVIVALSQTTADGLGGSLIDHTENDSIAKIASFSCQEFNKESEQCAENSSALFDLKYRLKELAATSKMQALPITRFQKHESTAALTAAVAEFNNGQYHAKFANIGDTVTLVIDPNSGRVKTTVPAHVCYQGFGNWTPMSLQMLADNSQKVRDRANKHLLEISENLAEGDIIIQMTDGIWAEFNCNVHVNNIESDEYKELAPATKEIEKCLKSLIDKNEYLSAQDFAKVILETALNHTSHNRKKFISLYQRLKPYIKDTTNEQMNDTVSAWLKKIATKKPKLAAEFKEFLVGGDHDGIKFSLDAPFHMVLTQITKQSFGDCSTISVMRAPYHCDELIRVLILHPENTLAILPRILAYSPAEIDSSLNRLRHEKFDPHCTETTGSKLNEINLKNVFTSNTLKFANVLIKHYRVLSAQFEQAENQPEASNYFKQSLIDITDIKLLAYLFTSLRQHPAIKIKKGFFNSLFSKQEEKTAEQMIISHALMLLRGKIQENPDKAKKLIEWGKQQDIFANNHDDLIALGRKASLTQ